MSKRGLTAMFCGAALLAGCGAPQAASLAPTPEAVAFLALEPAQVRNCIALDDVVVDGVAAVISGNTEAALASQVQRGVERCGMLAGLIEPSRFPPAQRPRAEACRAAFAGKVEAYVALNTALAAEGDFFAAQAGARRFLSSMNNARPQMERCNTPVA